ncbi:hypothetical protein PR202_ga31106 [Eleusine coracana subsp. coracana]|uniref:RNA-binding protein AU-1/Ribonuclease E/G domain-containing protein n=1 Tax=Eleusine coracana subsp. coracana TaxID=191504 RepID=A0AAV5DP65_ELECO|nr:hypothetical protein PR202_ga31106 [Eleusine coracana subsp. coracana]
MKSGRQFKAPCSGSPSGDDTRLQRWLPAVRRAPVAASASNSSRGGGTAATSSSSSSRGGGTAATKSSGVPASALNKRLVYEEMKKSVEKDRSTVGVSELSKLGLMEITRKRVREYVVCIQAASHQKSDPEKPKSWPRFVLRVDHVMCTYLTSGKKTKLGLLSSALKVWILLKIARGFSRGAFELLPYSDEKENDGQKETSSESPPKEAGSPKLSVFPIKKWMSHARRAK